MSARRSQVSWTTKLKSRLWPQEGWKAYGRDLLLRLRRMPGTPRSIAAGVACGIAISFTPFVGFHLLLAALTAWIIRGNILASALGTAAGNPWTFPFIWLSVLYTGRWMLGGDYAHSVQVDFIHFFEKATRALLHFDFDLFFQDIWPILWPMMVGCIPYYIAAWLASYYLVKKALEKIGGNGGKKLMPETGKNTDEGLS